MTTYPTRTPIETANIKAFIADSIAKRFPDGQIPRTAHVKVRVKLDAVGQARVIERMADDMLRHGEGMTRHDLKLAGYDEREIDPCAGPANIKARHRAGLN